LSQVGFSWVTTRHSFTFFFLPGKLLALDLGGALVPVFMISLSITSTSGFLTDLAGFTVVASFLASLVGFSVLVSFLASLLGFCVLVSFLASLLGLTVLVSFLASLLGLTVLVSLVSLLGLTVLVSSASLVGFLVVVSFLADFSLDGLAIICALKQTLINVKNKREKNYFTIDG
jgi:hypothetical protein